MLACPRRVVGLLSIAAPKRISERVTAPRCCEWRTPSASAARSAMLASALSPLTDVDLAGCAVLQWSRCNAITSPEGRIGLPARSSERRAKRRVTSGY